MTASASRVPRPAFRKTMASQVGMQREMAPASQFKGGKWYEFRALVSRKFRLQYLPPRVDPEASSWPCKNLRHQPSTIRSQPF
jgi:hypothetical protein